MDKDRWLKIEFAMLAVMAALVLSQTAAFVWRALAAWH
jgi:hypothetical protein